MVALLTSVRNSPCFGGLRRTKTCHRQLFVRPSMLFGYFLHDAKSDNSFPFAGSIEVLQTSNQRTKITISCNPIKSFCRSAASSGGYAAFFCCLRQPVAALAAIFSALRRYPCRDSTLRVLSYTFCTPQKSKKSTFPSGGGERAHKERGTGD